MIKEKYSWFVSGGAGFIGSAIVKTLVGLGQKVIVYDNFSSGKRENLLPVIDNITIIEGDIRDADMLLKSLANIDFVLHHAALVSVPQSMEQPLLTQEINVTATLNILYASAKNHVKRVVFASSSAVYGSNPNAPYSEQSTVNPESPYALSKLQGEELCSLYSKIYGLETVCLRYFNVFGPGQSATSAYAAVIPKFIESAAQGSDINIDWDGLQSRDFIYIGDIVKANILAALNAKSGEVYNVASGSSVTLLELADIIEHLSARKLNRVFRPKRGGDVKTSYADISKIKQLGFSPEVNLKDGLKNIFKANKDKAYD